SNWVPRPADRHSSRAFCRILARSWSSRLGLRSRRCLSRRRDCSNSANCRARICSLRAASSAIWVPLLSFFFGWFGSWARARTKVTAARPRNARSTRDFMEWSSQDPGAKRPSFPRFAQARQGSPPTLHTAPRRLPFEKHYSDDSLDGFQHILPRNLSVCHVIFCFSRKMLFLLVIQELVQFLKLSPLKASQPACHIPLPSFDFQQLFNHLGFQDSFVHGCQDGIEPFQQAINFFLQFLGIFHVPRPFLVHGRQKAPVLPA